MNRCEYCRQLSDGLECRRCGAPLPRVDVPVESLGLMNPCMGGVPPLEEFPSERAGLVNDVIYRRYTTIPLRFTNK